MRLLLDMHAFIWFFSGDRRLSRRAQRAIEDGWNAIYASAAVAYELSYKRDLGAATAKIVEEFDEGVRKGISRSFPSAFLTRPRLPSFRTLTGIPGTAS